MISNLQASKRKKYSNLRVKANANHKGEVWLLVSKAKWELSELWYEQGMLGIITDHPHSLPEQQLHYVPDINSIVLLTTSNQTTPQYLLIY